MYSFEETQKFRQWWLWVLILAMGAISISRLAMTQGGIGVMYMSIGVIGVVVLLLGVVKLDTKIDDTGIHYRFFPFMFSERVIEWNDVSQVYVRKYKPLWEYGGWGIRYTIRNGKAYNINGNMGMQLVMKNGKKILIGTQKPGELESLLGAMKKGGLIAALA